MNYLLPLICTLVGIAGVVFSLIIASLVKSAPTGSEKMNEIANAIKTGAIAYLNRQLKSMGIAGIIIFVIIVIIGGKGDAENIFKALLSYKPAKAQGRRALLRAREPLELVLAGPVEPAEHVAVGDAQVAQDRAKLLRKAHEVQFGCALAFEVRGHRYQRADRDDAGAADAGDHHRHQLALSVFRRGLSNAEVDGDTRRLLARCIGAKKKEKGQG